MSEYECEFCVSGGGWVAEGRVRLAWGVRGGVKFPSRENGFLKGDEMFFKDLFSAQLRQNPVG